MFLSFLDSWPAVTALCCLGMLVCWYAIDIEKSVKAKRQTVRVCDVGPHMSCSLVLTSRYSHMVQVLFGLKDNSMFNYSNAQYGFLFYFGLLVWQCYPLTRVHGHDLIFLLMTVSSVLASCGLAYILYAILHNLCLICVCMYVINGLLLISSIVRMCH